MYAPTRGTGIPQRSVAETAVTTGSALFEQLTYFTMKTVLKRPAYATRAHDSTCDTGTRLRCVAVTGVTGD